MEMFIFWDKLSVVRPLNKKAGFNHDKSEIVRWDNHHKYGRMFRMDL
jgi:hypothetical protein